MSFHDSSSERISFKAASSMHFASYSCRLGLGCGEIGGDGVAGGIY
jgi:hypothetical protein